MGKYILTIAMSVVSLSMMASSLADGLVGYWPFDDDANDASGNGNHGAVHGASLTNGKYGGAYYFDGSSSITVADSASLRNIDSAITIAVWIKPTAWFINSTGGKSKYIVVLAKEGSSSQQYALAYERPESEWLGDFLSLNYWIGAVVNNVKMPTLGNWQFVVVTLSGGKITYYYNGALSKTADVGVQLKPNNGILNIGMAPRERCEYFIGYMDELCIYNRALSASEINALYSGALRTAKTYTVTYHSSDETGTMESQVFEEGKEQKLSKNLFKKDGYVFQGWAKDSAERAELAAAGVIDVDYTDEQEITVDHDMTLYAVWAQVDCIVHFIPNGGEFKDKNGNVVKQFDQYFTYDEAQRLFTDELTPVRMDGNGNRFLGWSRGTPNIASSDLLFGGRQEWTFHDDVTEEWFYAVWTTTVTVSFYNSETTSGDKWLSPSSLADHLRWSVDDGSTGGRKTLGCGESAEVCPGRRIIELHCDDNYVWIVGGFGFDGHEPSLNLVNGTFELDISNDFTDQLIWRIPQPASRHVNVKVEPSSGVATKCVEFICSSKIRESLRNRIRPEDVPFDSSKVRITIGRVGYNASGSIVPATAYSLSGLEANERHYLPKGMYYVKEVSYNADIRGGDPYWGAVLDSNIEKRSFEVGDEGDTTVTIEFDLFGGDSAVRVEFDPQEGECERSEMWFEYSAGAHQPGARINHKLPEPKPKKEGVEFSGWFTARSGGQWKKEGSDITDCTLFAHWTKMTREWVEENTGALFPELAYLDIATVANSMSANGCRTVGECYALGIDPEDPNDDLRITAFRKEDGQPVITVNHTTDGSGNSFADRIRTLGKKSLMDAEWVDVTDMDQSEYRFFKVSVELDDGGSNGGGSDNGEDVNLDDFEIEQGVLQRYVGDAVDVVIPSSVTSIGNYLFAGNTNIVSVTIPGGVTNIGNYAFTYCSCLTNMTFAGNAPSVGSNAFQGDSACTVYVKRGSSGWGVTIPGTWNGMAIRFKEDDE